MAKELLVIDQVTKEKRPRSELWKAPNGRYYRSEADWLQMQAEKAKAEEEKRKNTALLRASQEILMDIMCVPVNAAPPTLILKRAKEIYSGYGIESFGETLARYYDDIIRAIQRKGIDESIGRGLYALAIVKNRIPDVYRELERNKKLKAAGDKTPEVDDRFEEISGQHKQYRDVTRLFG